MWPRWLLALWEADGKGPYTLHKGGDPLRRRDGQPLTRPNLTRVKLPVCNPEDGSGCNALLHRRYEERYQSLVERAFALDRLTAVERDGLGRWLLKTWLLSAHPQVWHEVDGHPQADLRPEPWTGAPDDLFSWLVAEPEVDPPMGFSVWVTRESSTVTVPMSERRHIPLPSFRVGSGPEVVFRSKTTTVFDLTVALVHHPGWRIDHPAETEGKAARLWPPEGTDLDLSAMPIVPKNETQFAGHPRLGLAEGSDPERDLPPLSPDINLGLTTGAIVFYAM